MTVIILSSNSKEELVDKLSIYEEKHDIDTKSKIKSINKQIKKYGLKQHLSLVINGSTLEWIL